MLQGMQGDDWQGRSSHWIWNRRLHRRVSKVNLFIASGSEIYIVSICFSNHFNHDRISYIQHCVFFFIKKYSWVHVGCFTIPDHFKDTYSGDKANFDFLTNQVINNIGEDTLDNENTRLILSGKMGDGSDLETAPTDMEKKRKVNTISEESASKGFISSKKIKG